MKNFAVLGPKSMIGERIIHQLQDMQNVSVITIGRDSDCDIIIDLENNSFYTKKEIPKIDVIFHCISTFENNSVEGMKKNIQINTISSLTIIDLLEVYNINYLIYAGTIFSSENVLSSYGLSKFLAENIFSHYCQIKNKKFLSLRFSQINDFVGKCIKHQPWFGRIIRYTSKGFNLNMPEEKSLNNFLHINDVISILIKSYEKDLQGTYDVIHPFSCSYHEIARMAYKIFNQGGEVEIDKNKKPFHYINFKYDDTIYQHLGFYPKWKISDTIQNIKDINSSELFGPLDVE